MSQIIIKSIAVSNGCPKIKFDRVHPLAIESSTFPGTGSEPVMPTPAFMDAYEAVSMQFSSVFSLPPDWVWELKTVGFSRDEEISGYGIKAGLSSFIPAIGKQTIALAQNSPSHVDPTLKNALDALLVQAEKFVDGAIAQGSLFDE